jgi:ABC-type multidrug transport system fused ATPase/permease subunit
MDVDPMEFVEQEDEGDAAANEQDARKSRLNAMIAITVALLAGFMAICSIKGGNIAQQMQQAQAKSIDYWAWYQARKIRTDIAEATADQMRALASAYTGSTRAVFSKLAEKHSAEAARQTSEMKGTQADAKSQDKLYEALNVHDDQFDVSEAFLALAISLMAVTSLTQKRWLYFVALVPTAVGLFMGLAGLFDWPIDPGALTKFLS